MQSTHPLPPSNLGHYQILREAGRGGMSVVYEAVDNRIGRRVALKVLSMQMSAASESQDARVARFKRESRAIARLSHPNIVTIYDIGEEDGQHFIVMEYLEGETLRERTQASPIAPPEAAVILRQVASGLDAVHEAGIVHRDIKPSNVMLLPDGQAKLMDFGVARQHEDTMVTQAGAMVGSPVYMSPEQVNGQEHEAASDLWSLGVILYEMLAGHAPFGGETIPNVLYQVAYAAPAPLPGAPLAVQQVLLRALDKNPAQRYRSGKEMADAFDAALKEYHAALVPLAAPAAPAPRALRPAARSRRARLVWPAALCLALLAAGLLALTQRRAAVTQKPVPVRQVHSVSPRRHPSLVHAAAATHAARPRLSAAARAAHGRSLAATRATRARVLARTPAVSAPPSLFQPAVVPKRRIALVRQRHLSRRIAAAPLAQDAPERLARPAPPMPARVQVSVGPAPLASSPEPATGPNILGTWHGSNSRNPATLVITRRQGNTFAGTMNVRTHEANVRIAVSGHVSPKTGAMTMRETQVISASKPRAWDLGQELGRVFHNGRMSGTSSDVKGRSGAWSFSR